MTSHSSPRRINFGAINRAALGCIESLCMEWIPEGKAVKTDTGPNWVGKNPVRDEKNPSFSVSLDSGAFYDYADPSVKGGDPVALYAYIYSVSMKASAVQLAQRFGVPLYENESVVPTGVNAPDRPVPKPSERAVVPREESPWVPVVPAPASAGDPHVAHVRRGKPERTWCYRGPAGEVLGYVYRFVTSTGGKEVLPLVWARNKENGREEWHWMQWPMPRPLYGLDRLAAKPLDTTVLIVEGEKCADAGHASLASLACVSWPGGCKAEWKADWTPLKGRRVVIWPDCDSKRIPLTRQEKDAGIAEDCKPFREIAEQPGMHAALRIAERLTELGCEVWIVEVPPPGVKPDGWDIADAIEDGMDEAAIVAFIQSNAKRHAPAEQGEEDSSEASKGSPAAGPAGAGNRDTGPRGEWRDLMLYGGESKSLIDCRENVYLMLEHHPALQGLLASDTFAKKIVKTRVPPWGGEAGEWQEHDDLRLGLWLSQAEYLRIRSAENIAAAVAWCAADNGFHPVMDYLDALKWDGRERLEFWLTDYLGVRQSVYTMLTGKMSLIGMVARIYEPGCILRMMPILEGKQFRGKSTALRILGGEWFADTPIDLNNKDSYQLILGRWLYEIAELDSFNRAESTRMKAFVSSPVDRFRAPYERAPKDHRRNVMFFGSTNQDEYFKDQTGNTRYWPWLTMQDGPIDLEKLATMRDQLFAEAVVRYKRKERWHPTREEQDEHFEREQEMREIADPWESIVESYLRKMTFKRVTVTELLMDCIKVEPSKIDGTRSMSTRIGNIMKRFGWHKRREGGSARGYFYDMPDGWRDGSAGKIGDEDEPF